MVAAMGQRQGVVLTPSMDQRDLRIAQTGPGQYEASFDLNEHGNYLVNMRYTSPDKDAGLINTGVSVPYSPEFRELGANTSLLQQSAERTGGRVLDFNSARSE